MLCYLHTIRPSLSLQGGDICPWKISIQEYGIFQPGKYNGTVLEVHTEVKDNFCQNLIENIFHDHFIPSFQPEQGEVCYLYEKREILQLF